MAFSNIIASAITMVLNIIIIVLSPISLFARVYCLVTHFSITSVAIVTTKNVILTPCSYVSSQEACKELKKCQLIHIALNN